MAGEKERVDAYLDTIARLEPDIAMIDAGAGWASVAISLKRIADAAELTANVLVDMRDALEKIANPLQTVDAKAQQFFDEHDGRSR